MKHFRFGAVSGLLFFSTVVMAQTPTPPGCGGNPVDTWEHALASVKSGDAGRVKLTLTTDKRSREALLRTKPVGERSS